MGRESLSTGSESSRSFDWTYAILLAVSGFVLCCAIGGIVVVFGGMAATFTQQQAATSQSVFQQSPTRPRPTPTPRRSATVEPTEPGIVASHPEGVMDLAYSLDGSMVYSMGRYDGRLVTWDADSHEPVHEAEIDVPLFTFGAMAFSEDRTLLATGDDRYVHVWNIATGEAAGSFQGLQAEIAGIAFSPDGARLVATSQDYQFAVWDFDSGEMESVTSRFGAAVQTLVFSPDENWLAVGQGDVLLLDGETFEETASLSMEGDAVTAAAFSPDSTLITGAGRQGSVVIWDVESGTILASWKAHEGPIRELAWSPDGEIIATGSADNSVAIWNAATGEELRRFANYSGGVTALDWSPDGEEIVAGDAEGAVVWEEVAP